MDQNHCLKIFIWVSIDFTFTILTFVTTIFSEKAELLVFAISLIYF